MASMVFNILAYNKPTKIRFFSGAYLRVSKNDGGTSTAVSLPNLFDAVIRSYDLDLQ